MVYGRPRVARARRSSAEGARNEAPKALKRSSAEGARNEAPKARRRSSAEGARNEAPRAPKRSRIERRRREGRAARIAVHDIGDGRIVMLFTVHGAFWTPIFLKRRSESTVRLRHVDICREISMRGRGFLGLFAPKLELLTPIILACC